MATENTEYNPILNQLPHILTLQAYLPHLPVANTCVTFNKNYKVPQKGRKNTI